ncbi:hypothetical protein BgiBS90_000829 [Biomphalaria glabrata]|nr:hypothetical protein BgiBS90_000829 [Biomphalaria glabrata]
MSNLTTEMTIEITTEITEMSTEMTTEMKIEISCEVTNEMTTEMTTKISYELPRSSSPYPYPTFSFMHALVRASPLGTFLHPHRPTLSAQYRYSFTLQDMTYCLGLVYLLLDVWRVGALQDVTYCLGLVYLLLDVWRVGALRQVICLVQTCRPALVPVSDMYYA